MKLIFLFSAQFGGATGLCVGFSLLSGAEIFYFFTIRILCRMSRDKRSKVLVKEKYTKYKYKYCVYVIIDYIRYLL